MLIIVPHLAEAQSLTDSASLGRGASDSMRITPHNVKNSLWGNSTYFSAAVNLTKNKEFDFGIGRTYGQIVRGDRGLGYITTASWGAGYSVALTNAGPRHAVKAFQEYGFFPMIILFNMGFRGEYIYNITDRQHYLRPSVGMNLVHLDILYNYSFLLNGKVGENVYRHGVSFRFKAFAGRKNWRQNEYRRTH